MTSVLGVINAFFKTAVHRAYPGLSVGSKTIVQPSAGGKFGDYKCTSAMQLAQVYTENPPSLLDCYNK